MENAAAFGINGLLKRLMEDRDRESKDRQTRERQDRDRDRQSERDREMRTDRQGKDVHSDRKDRETHRDIQGIHHREGEMPEKERPSVMEGFGTGAFTGFVTAWVLCPCDVRVYISRL